MWWWGGKGLRAVGEPCQGRQLLLPCWPDSGTPSGHCSDFLLRPAPCSRTAAQRRAAPPALMDAFAYNSCSNQGLSGSSNLSTPREHPPPVLTRHICSVWAIQTGGQVSYLDCSPAQSSEAVVISPKGGQLLPRAAGESYCGEGKKRLLGNRGLLEATQADTAPDVSP